MTVGSWHRGFNRLIKDVDKLISEGVITDHVIAQTGYGSYIPNHMDAMDFCSPDEFRDLISRSRMVISHAGVGTIAQAVKELKPVVVVPRQARLAEHFDDHQFVTAETLEKEGKILVAYEIDALTDKIRAAENFIPKQSQGAHEILRAVQEFIEGIIEKKG